MKFIIKLDHCLNGESGSGHRSQLWYRSRALLERAGGKLISLPELQFIPTGLQLVSSGGDQRLVRAAGQAPGQASQGRLP